MFDKLKQLQQARAIQQALSQERIEVEENGVRIILRGDLVVEEVSLNESLSLRDQELAVKNCFQKAVRETQRVMAQKMSGMLGS